MPRSSSACRSSRSDCSRGWCAASSTARRGARSRSLRSTCVLARTVWRRAGERLRLLAESFLALGVVFATLAIPLALEGRWTSAAWALEGAAIVWVGVRQQRLAARLFGLALQFLAGLAFLADPSRMTGALPLANTFYLACLFLALGGLLLRVVPRSPPRGRSPAASGSSPTSCSAGASCGGWSAACTRSTTTSGTRTARRRRSSSSPARASCSAGCTRDSIGGPHATSHSPSSR